MNTEGFELELKQFDSSLLLAEDSFSFHDYEESLSRYKTALTMAQALFRPVSEQVVSCMLRLADCYFELNHLDEAKHTYEELLVTYAQIPEVDPEQVIAVLFKLARIADKKNDIAAADAAYYRTLKQAEAANLPLVHSMFIAIAKPMQTCCNERT